MNKVLIVGRLTRDPETRTTSSGIKYSRFTVAVSRTYGENQTDFIPVVAWRNQADFLDKYMSKGRMISVEGSFTSSNYEKDGSRVYSYEVTADKVQALDSANQASNKKAQTRTSESSIPTTPQARIPAVSATSEESFKLSPSEQNSTSQEQILKFEEETKLIESDANNTDIPWDLDL